MVKPMEDIHRQHINSTKNAGSSLANCDFVSRKNLLFHSDNTLWYHFICKVTYAFYFENFYILFVAI